MITLLRIVRPVCLLIAVVLTTQPASVQGAASATAPGVHPRIIGGHATTAASFPFMVALVNAASLYPAGYRYANDYDAQFCGGSLIASRWVLTAAHCVKGKQPSAIEVIAGQTTLSHTLPGAPRIAVAGVRTHPAFDDYLLANDIALLLLDSPATPSAMFALDDGSTLDTLSDGADLTAIGWGVMEQPVPGDSYYDIKADTLQEATLDYLSRATCNDYGIYDGSLPRGVLCATFLDGAPRDACRGDSGGPLLLPLGGGSWRQVGVTSFGGTDRCANPGHPGVFTGVGHFRRFIDDVQTRPALRTTITNVSNMGNSAIVRVRVTNDSPSIAATSVQLTISTLFSLDATNFHDLIGCVLRGSGGDSVLCDLGTVEPRGGARSFEIRLNTASGGKLYASATSPAGDDYTDDNIAERSFGTPLTLQPSSGSGGGGSIPFVALIVLSLLLVRRPGRSGTTGEPGARRLPTGTRRRQ